MKTLIILGISTLISACSLWPKQHSYPYGMTDNEWNELSIQDKTAIRRDFYFVEKGNLSFVNPELEVEGKPELVPAFRRQTAELSEHKSTQLQTSN